jgi:hypothetical protein
MGKKRLKEATCKHPHCGEPIYYSTFTATWLHWSTAGEACPNNTVAEPIEDGHGQTV